MKHKKICIITVICALLAIVARLVALMNFTEASTGFTKKDYGAATGQVVCAFITVVACVLPFLLCRYMSKRQPTKPTDIKKFPVLMIASWLMAAVMLVLSAELLPSGISALGLIGSIIYLLSALFFIVYAVSYFTGRAIAPFLTFFPILAMIYKLVELFIGFNGVTTIFENAYDLIFLCVTLYFFLLHGRIIANSSLRSASRRLFAVGMLGSVLSACCTIPYYIIVLVGKSATLHNPHLNLDYIIFGIYMAVYTLCLFSKSSLPQPKNHVPSVRPLDTHNDETIMPSTGFYMSDQSKSEDEKFPGLTKLEDEYKNHDASYDANNGIIRDNFIIGNDNPEENK